TNDPSTTTTATVQLDLYNASGVRTGSCAGTMIAPTTVLTSGHCVVGKTWWKVMSPSTGQVAHGVTAYSYDWKDFQSSMSDPKHHDLAVIKLDAAINLPTYPGIADQPMADGTAAMRMRANANAFEAVAVRTYDGAAKGFPYYYMTEIDPSETLTTGSALIDP